MRIREIILRLTNLKTAGILTDFKVLRRSSGGELAAKPCARIYSALPYNILHKQCKKIKKIWKFVGLYKTHPESACYIVSLSRTRSICCAAFVQNDKFALFAQRLLFFCKHGIILCTCSYFEERWITLSESVSPMISSILQQSPPHGNDKFRWRICWCDSVHRFCSFPDEHFYPGRGGTLANEKFSTCAVDDYAT